MVHVRFAEGEVADLPRPIHADRRPYDLLGNPGDPDRPVRPARPGHLYVYRNNHQSVFDICARVATIPADFHFMAKKELGPFKGGGFHLAIRAQAQVPGVPVSISGSRHITPKGSLRVESGTVKIRYGEPISTQGLVAADRGALKERVRQAILQGYEPDFVGVPTMEDEISESTTRRPAR